MPDGKTFARAVIRQASAYVRSEARVLAIARRYIADVYIAPVILEFAEVVSATPIEEMGETEADLDVWIDRWMRRKVEREPSIAIEMNPR